MLLTHKIIIGLVVGYLFIFIFSCKKEEIKQVELDNTGFNPTYLTPPHLPNLPPMHNPEFNKMTMEGVQLGKKLYYDNVLSTNSRSCSSCHKNNFSYSAPYMGPIGTAILPHLNLGWYNRYGWFGGDEYLDFVALVDLEEGNPFLQANSDSISNRLNKSVEYQQLFFNAFGIEITKQADSLRNQYISFALAQFMRTMVSIDSRFDRYLRGEILLTPSEINGYEIFMREDKGDCFHCHGSASNPMWTDFEYHNNALNSNFTGVDLGMYNISGNINDIGKFKTPTLRNIELTSPYMHDNRFTTLEQVIDFYSEGLQNSPYVDPLMQKINQGGVQLTLAEKQDLI
ncbi:MAG: cytochrome-c peroxidase, partial [Flavobacteriales bacterium]|nr:cytochrome-c peroxidase [Flavobacteriales bacterium]